MADHISLHLHQRWVISDWIVAKQMAKLLGCPLKAFRNYDKLIFPFLLNLSKDLCLVVDYHFVLNKITYGIASVSHTLTFKTLLRNHYSPVVL